jgi:hypothetical protein
MSKITIEISPGELVDRTTILRIKSVCISDPRKLAAVCSGLVCHEALVGALPFSAELQRLIDQLLAINTELWEIEDDLRACEGVQDFGSAFVELARAVYRLNDARFETKREIDQLLGSPLSEVKSYGNV